MMMKFELDQLPVIDQTFSYDNDEEKLKVAKDIAKAVAELYAYFLTDDAHSKESLEKSQKKGMWLDLSSAGTLCPSADLIEKFQRLLEKAIQKEIMAEEGLNLTLSTDYSPEGTLEDILEEAGITRDDFSDYHSFFPYKSCTWITSPWQKQEIQVSINLKGPLI